jgi:DNA-binding response OmpR family regulator
MSKILVVEDDESVRRLVIRVLDLGGYESEEASSGAEALEKLAAQHYELVVLDLMLGPVSGWNVLEEMNRKGIRSSTRVIMLTARTSERDFMNGWRLGVDQYLTKPFDPSALTEAVEDTLQQTPEQLAERRKAELQKAELLYRLESAFDQQG